jgi:hypothetical protein
VPSTAIYLCRGINATDPLAILTITGTSGAHAVVRSNSGGAFARIVNNGNDHSGKVNATYCDFLRMGDATHPAFDPILGGGDIFSFTNCTFTTCGTVGNSGGTGAYDGGALVNLDHCTWSGSTANSYAMPGVDRSGGGTRNLLFCNFDAGVLLYPAGGYTIEDCILRSWDITNGTWTGFARNLHVAVNGVNDMAVPGPVTDCYFVRLGAQDNPHYIAAVDQTTRITGCVFDAADTTTGNGDCITFGSGFGSPVTVTIDHCIVTRTNGTDVNSGTIMSCLGNVNVTVVIEHCTYHGGQGAYFGETYGGHASMGTVRNCLSFAGTNAYIIRADPGVAVNVVPGASAHHNGIHNPAATNGYDTNLTFTPATQGSGDVSGDPQFVDYNRNIKTWDASLGGPGTIANALTEIAVGNRTISALLTYVRAGHAPANQAFHAASDNVSPSNGWIGAVAGSAAGGGNPPGRRRSRRGGGKC